MDFPNSAAGTATNYHARSLAITSALTVSDKHFLECWLKIDTGGSYCCAVSVGEASGYLIIMVTAGTYIVGYFRQVGGGTTTVGGSIYNTGTWYHVGVVWDGTQMHLYINGTNTHSKTPSPNYAGLPASSQMRLGCWPTNTNFAFDGKVCNARFMRYTGTFNTSLFQLTN